MKRNTGVSLFVVIVLLFSLLLGLSACKEEQDPTTTGAGTTTTVPNNSTTAPGATTTAPQPSIATYTVSFEKGAEATGELPVVQMYRPGESFMLPECELINDGYLFAGWSDGKEVFQAGAAYVMPENAVKFTATWEEIRVFAQEAYTYDRSVGEDMEIPVELYGANIYTVKLDGQIVVSSAFAYDADTKCLVLKQAYVASLEKGEHSLLLVTDDDRIDSAQCKLNIITTLETSFDSVTVKNFVFGKDSGVSFHVDFKTATVRSLMAGDQPVEEAFYSLEDNTFTVKAEYLKYLYKATDFTLTLSSNDVYHFTIISNVIFYTDYDRTTIHNETASNIGHNPLYQYYDNIAIIPGENGMDGNVLKFTPNTEDVLYGCDNIFTLKNPVLNDWMWYDVGYSVDKNYCISFDYMPVGTSNGEFYFHNVSGSVREDLKMGEENNGKSFHFDMYLTGAQIAEGTAVYAQFKNGSGYILVDNFRIVEVDGIPGISLTENYTVGSEADYVFSADLQGYSYTLNLNGKPVYSVYDSQAKTITIAAADLANVTVGENKLQIVTDVHTYDLALMVVNNLVAELTESNGVYKEGVTDSLIFHGNISDGITVVSIKQNAKVTNGGYGDRNYFASDLEYNFALSGNYNLVSGMDGSGYLELTKAFLGKLYGVTELVVEFSNGMKQTVTVVSNNQMASDYDSTTIYAPWGDGSSPLSSGMTGEFMIQEREAGNNGLYIFSSNGPATCYFTIRQHDHPWAWYTITMGDTQYMRVVFDYQISGLPENSVFARVIFSSAAMRDKMQSDTYEAVDSSFTEARWYLKTDGQVHTIDTGWIPYDADAGLFNIVLPVFDKAEGVYVMLDNFKLTTAELPVTQSAVYDKDAGGNFTFGLDSYEFLGLKAGESVVAATCKNGVITVSQEEMAKLPSGENIFVVQTSAGSFRLRVSIVEKIAELTELTGVYKEGITESVVLRGNISDGITVVSIKQNAKVTNGGYGDRNYFASNTEFNFADPANYNLVAGMDGSGYLELTKAFVGKLYGVTELVVEFSNGMKQTVTVVSTNQMASDYDTTTIYAPWGDVSSPLSSGMTGEFMIQEREAGNNGLYIFSSNGPATCYFTVRQHDHPWAWYTITMGDTQYMRVVFDYQISGLPENSVFARVIFSSAEMRDKMQSDTYVADDSGFNEARWYLNTDGQVHTLDTGWIPYDAGAGLFNIVLPVFDKAEGVYVMIDNFKLTADELPSA